MSRPDLRLKNGGRWDILFLYFNSNLEVNHYGSDHERYHHRRYSGHRPRDRATRGETVAEACMVHGVDVDALLGELNNTIAANQK